MANPIEDNRRWRCAGVNEVIGLDKLPLLGCCCYGGFTAYGDNDEDGEAEVDWGGENSDALSGALVMDYAAEAKADEDDITEESKCCCCCCCCTTADVVAVADEILEAVRSNIYYNYSYSVRSYGS